VVLWKHSVVREVQHFGVCSRRTSANEERRGQTLCDKEKSKQGAPFWDSPMFPTTSSHISHCLAPEDGFGLVGRSGIGHRRVLLGPWRETASCATEAALPRVHIRPPERRRNFKKFSIPTRRFASAKEMFGGKCD
ncbi:unnamed protein product, partial [Nesidiocoris tenuis]